jgi:hypothetical protein
MRGYLKGVHEELVLVEELDVRLALRLLPASAGPTQIIFRDKKKTMKEGEKTKRLRPTRIFIRLNFWI